MRALKNVPDGLTKWEIYKGIGAGRQGTKSFEEALSGVTRIGRARLRKQPTGPKGGRPTERYVFER